ncbi:hypothetical protein [Cohnella kolymensis]|uniref:hypothetical protein n=1 Tax=Cohnella kolymensis TaxID=1590652 RepID=UPI000695E883|nr:hypothetical protein [Cohnella kolymensis]
MAEVEVTMIIEMKEDIASIKSTLNTMVNTNTTAMEALQSSRFAHDRLNRIDKIVFWAGTTVVGSIIIALIAFIVAGGIAPGKD